MSNKKPPLGQLLRASVKYTYVYDPYRISWVFPIFSTGTFSIFHPFLPVKRKLPHGGVFKLLFRG